jgi:WD40 repeat protein
VGSHSGWVRSIAFGDEVLVSAGEDGIIKLWDVGSRALIKAWPAHAGKVHAVAYDDGLQILVSCGNDTQICIWDMTGKLIRALNGSTQHSRAVAVAKGMIVAGCDDQYVRIWSTDSFDLQCEYHAHSRWVFSVAIDQRNSRILSGGEDGAICEYHLPSGTRRTISIDRLYEGLRIDRIRGVSDGQLRELAALGARVR